MKMSRSADERRMPQSRSRPARRREGGAWLGFAIALWAPKVGAAPHRPSSHCVESVDATQTHLRHTPGSPALTSSLETTRQSPDADASDRAHTS